MAISLDGQRVLIIGAAGGIGEATVEAFTLANAAVTAAGRMLESVEELCGRLNATPAALDFLDNNSIEAFFRDNSPFDHVVMREGRVHRLESLKGIRARIRETGSTNLGRFS
jgi:NADP-dependent 3-hydroxy acid dehydrogenase YdfG